MVYTHALHIATLTIVLETFYPWFMSCCIPFKSFKLLTTGWTFYKLRKEEEYKRSKFMSIALINEKLNIGIA